MFRLGEGRSDGSHRVAVHRHLVVELLLGGLVLGVVAADQLMQGLERVFLAALIGPRLRGIPPHQRQQVVQTVANRRVGESGHYRSRVGIVATTTRLDVNEAQDGADDAFVPLGQSGLIGSRLTGARHVVTVTSHAIDHRHQILVVTRQRRRAIGRDIGGLDLPVSVQEVRRRTADSLVHRVVDALLDVLDEGEPRLLHDGLEEGRQTVLAVEQLLLAILVRRADADAIRVVPVPLNGVHQVGVPLEVSGPLRAVGLVVLRQETEGFHLVDLLPGEGAAGRRGAAGRGRRADVLGLRAGDGVGLAERVGRHVFLVLMRLRLEDV